MIVVGIDAVDIKRFSRWATYSPSSLRRVFSPTEIEYCLRNPVKSSERFAARFAAKEALYKALYQLAQEPIPAFLTVCAHSEVLSTPQGPQLRLSSDTYVLPNLTCASIQLSLTHTQTTAIAVVIISYFQ